MTRQFQNFATAIAQATPTKIPITKPDTEMSKNVGCGVLRLKILDGDTDPPALTIDSSAAVTSQRIGVQMQDGCAIGAGTANLPKAAAMKTATAEVCNDTNIRAGEAQIT